MPRYTAPLDDWQFLLHDVLQLDRYADVPGFADLDRDTTHHILTEAARFHTEVLHPINLAADREGARLEHGRVRTPAGFRQAWQAYRTAGWHRLTLPAEWGGAGLPPLLAAPLSELRAATGHSFSMYSSFCAPTASMLASLGTDWMRAHVVPRLAAGDWTATMCMTEAQAGSDLRLLTTRAEPQPDGSWRLRGHKIFISGGDHDLTDNIVHVVLAKIAQPGQPTPDGLGAVGVFLVSSRDLDPATGTLAGANGVTVQGLEHKMGIAGSATCALAFEDARGWQITDPRHTGSAANMAPMFLLMNYARVGTAMSGVAYADLAHQNAADYARERRSGRADATANRTASTADPIVAHPDVRRLLLDTRAFAEGGRAGALQLALWQSLAQHASDPQQRQHATDLLNVLTPIVKAFYTDCGFAATVACQQVFGGHGYIQDHGIEQWVRNARIGQIYEGANGIQALDLVQRKLTAHGGRPQQVLLAWLRDSAAETHPDPDRRALAVILQQGCDQVEAALHTLDERRASAPQAVAAGAYDLLTALGILYVGASWLRVVDALDRATCTLSAEQKHAKRVLAELWIRRQLPMAEACCRRACEDPAALVALADALV